MSPIYRSIIAASLAILLTSGTAMAQSTDQDRIKALEQENNELRQELAQLRLELSQAKRELKKHAADADENAADQSPSEPADPQAAQPDEKKDDKGKPRVFRSADEIYRSIPQDMRPARDGWDIVEKQTVADWLKTNITGKSYEARKEISDIKIRYDTIKRIWEVRLYFEYEKMRFMSWDMEERLNGVLLRGDKTFADNARKKYKAGGTVNVSGTISVIAWDSFIIQSADKNWHPTHCRLTLDAPQIK